jgi:hypothetical protein
LARADSTLGTHRGCRKLLTVWLKPDVLHVSHTDVSRFGSSPVE